MAFTHDSGPHGSASDEETILQEVLGYLNFSNGKPDAGFQSKIDALQAGIAAERPWPHLQERLRAHLERLKGAVAAFRDSSQAEAVLDLVFDRVWPAYRAHHSDLLFHLSDADLQQPFFLARIFEAVLAEGSPWDETDRIVRRTLNRLNDYIGFRPIAVLENGRKMEPYPHERFRPIPLYIRDAGVAHGEYHALISRTIAFFREAPPEILNSAYFHLEHLDELAIDVRAHDHTHPVNKRTNYMFGEWDPHLIDTKGYYRRFVVRKIILDSLVEWIALQRNTPLEEVLYDASAVLCGTILMASAISGSGPDTHDSSVTLTSLLPKVARQRDMFYTRLMQVATGARAERLRREAELVQQPFGHVRQHLNLHLANYGARQVQHRHLAQMFARMGYVEAGREQAAIIPSASARIECEIECHITTAQAQLDRGEVAEAATTLEKTEEFLHRGIGCGALVDPWNILGFQGHFPLFSSREDSVPDHRVEALLEIMERFFAAYSRALGEAAARGEREQSQRLSQRFQALADYWDQFATTTVEDIPDVSGKENWESATHVSQALAEWHAAGEAAGDLSFWRGHVEQFQSAKAYALVVEALVEKNDLVAAMALLIQWFSQVDAVGLESGPHSLPALLLRWMHRATAESEAGSADGDCWPTIRRLFDYLEANAGTFWSVPSFMEAAGVPSGSGDAYSNGGERREVDDEFDEEFFEDEDDEDDEEQLFQAAYDDVVFRDSALDGHDDDTLEGGYAPGTTEFELISRNLEPHLKFLMTLAQLWQIAAAAISAQSLDAKKPDSSDESERNEVLLGWRQRTRELQTELTGLLNAVWDHEIAAPSGEHDSNIEYDLQLQTKFYLLHNVIATHINCRVAERSLLCCLPAGLDGEDVPPDEQDTVQLYRGVLTRNVDLVRNLLPGFLKRLYRKPLLYVPLENGGHPIQILQVRTVQTDIRFLLSQLPRLGLLRETWHLLRTAYRMERASRPAGLAVTEFDRIFRTALRNTLECVVDFSKNWKSGRFTDEELIDVVGEVVEHYVDQWLRHSRTTRLSTVEAIDSEDLWGDVRDFVEKYGGDLFHARMLTLGNVRAILHNGIEWFLDYLIESEDPLHPIRLLEDLESGKVDGDEVVQILELVYGTVVDKFDRFLEYNTTTTQSDYGEMFYCLLDFLRLEAAYDRDAWNFAPIGVAHKVLSQRGRMGAVEIWESVFMSKSADAADRHLAELRELEETYGVRLPSVTDRLNERFVKPMAVNRMLALVPRAIEDARTGQLPSQSFEALRDEINDYLDSTLGSGIDVPPWLQSLEKEVNRHSTASHGLRHKPELEVKAPPVPLNLRDMRQQLRTWEQPLIKPGKRKKKPDA